MHGHIIPGIAEPRATKEDNVKFISLPKNRWLFSCWITIAMTAGFGGAIRADDATDQNEIQVLARLVHFRMLNLYTKLGDFSDAQKAQITDLERLVGKWLKTHRQNTPAEFGQQFYPPLRNILTPDQLKKLDDILAQQAAIATANHLNQIGMALDFYARDHKDMGPPDIGTLVGKDLSPEVFLSGGSRVKVPSNFEKLDPPLKIEWANAKTDFVFLAAGKKIESVARFVTTYVRPSAAPDGNFFLLNTGRVIAQDAAKSKAIIDELAAGKNPPPSLDFNSPDAPTQGL